MSYSSSSGTVTRRTSIADETEGPRDVPVTICAKFMTTARSGHREGVNTAVHGGAYC